MTLVAICDAITQVMQKERHRQRSSFLIDGASELPTVETKASSPDNSHVTSSFASSLLDFAFRRDKRSRKEIEHTSSVSLSNIAIEELETVLEPIVQQLKELDAESLLHLTRVSSGGARLKDGVQVRPIYDEIQPPPSLPCDEPNDFSNASSADELHVVRYIHLHEEPNQYSVGIFVFPPHGKIPLHDHPGMCVLSRILYGDLQRISLDLPPTDELNVPSPGQRRRAFYRAPPQRPLYLNRESSSYSSTDSSITSTPTRSRIPVDHLVAPQCTVLYPREGNLHEFVAGPNGAAVLDVLLPPYDADHHRDCTFYEIDHGSSSLVDENDPSSMDAAPVEQDTASQLVPCWIIPTGRPENFHCISGQYRELGEA